MKDIPTIVGVRILLEAMHTEAEIIHNKRRIHTEKLYLFRKERKMKKKHMAAAGLLIICGLVIVFLLPQFEKKNADKKIVSQLKQSHMAQRRLEDSMIQQGWDMKQLNKERLIPIEYADREGNTIVLYQYYHSEPLDDFGGGSAPMVYDAVLNPDTAEEENACLVGDLPGTIYRKGDRAFLWWEKSPVDLLILDYNPGLVAESDIIKMADSCQAVSME